MALEMKLGIKRYLISIVKKYEDRKILIRFFVNKESGIIDQLAYHIMSSEEGTAEWDAERAAFPEMKLLNTSKAV